MLRIRATTSEVRLPLRLKTPLAFLDGEHANSNGPWRDPTRTRDHEEGAILILALVFIIIISVSVLGLLTFGGTGLTNTTSLKGQRSLEYAADGAVTAAIQAVRYSSFAFDNGTSPSEANCLPDGSVLTEPDTTQYPVVEGDPQGSSPPITSLVVDCSGSLNTWPLPAQNTREVTFSACIVAPGPCLPLNSIVTAAVYFQDVLFNSATRSEEYECSLANNTTCGTGVVIKYWDVTTANN
jgi:hypothetical protein